MLRLIAIIFGIVFIFAGVAGFLPSFTTNGFVFGYFKVSTVQNIVLLISGIVAIMAATSYYLTKRFFLVFGVLYLLFAIIGFWRQGDLLIMQVNTAGNVLHLIIGLLSLYLWWYSRRHPVY